MCTVLVVVIGRAGEDASDHGLEMLQRQVVVVWIESALVPVFAEIFAGIEPLMAPAALADIGILVDFVIVKIK